MATEEHRPLIHVEHLSRDYQLGQTVVHALRDVSLDVSPGELVAVMGASGSGKSTFMNLLGCLDRPTSGVYLLDGIDVAELDADALAYLRNRNIGFVFQGFNLLPRMSAFENVTLPMVYAGVPSDVMALRGAAALAAVGLANRGGHRPAEMSGGEQQRVAIARALVNGPALILADEPTGNLDSRTSKEIVALLQELNRHGITMVVVTHEPDIAAHFGRTIRFLDGRVVEDRRNPAPLDAARELAEGAKDEAVEAGA